MKTILLALLLSSVSLLSSEPTEIKIGQPFNIIGDVSSKQSGGVLVEASWVSPCGSEFGGPPTTVFITDFPNMDAVYDGCRATCTALFEGTMTTEYGATIRKFKFVKMGISH
jgi:hypothetical protein